MRGLRARVAADDVADADADAKHKAAAEVLAKELRAVEAQLRTRDARNAKLSEELGTLRRRCSEDCAASGPLCLQRMRREAGHVAVEQFQDTGLFQLLVEEKARCQHDISELQIHNRMLRARRTKAKHDLVAGQVCPSSPSLRFAPASFSSVWSRY